MVPNKSPGTHTWSSEREEILQSGRQRLIIEVGIKNHPESVRPQSDVKTVFKSGSSELYCGSLKGRAEAKDINNGFGRSRWLVSWMKAVHFHGLI